MRRSPSPAAPGRESAVGRFRKRMRHKWLGAIGGALVLGSVLIALSAPFGLDPNNQNLSNRLLPIWSQADGIQHILGTDPLGRDVFARLASGAGASLVVATMSLVLGGGFGVAMGLIAGYKGGWIDAVVARLIDAQLALPNLVFAMIVSAVLGTGLLTTAIALGFSTWPIFARLIRGQTLRVKYQAFVEAAHVSGTSTRRLLRVHILPNVVDAALAVAPLELGHMIRLESSLSFIGLGVQAPNASLGTMVRDAQPHVFDQWWLAAIPGLLIAILVLGFNLLGDWLRDVIDPRVQQTQRQTDPIALQQAAAE